MCKKAKKRKRGIKKYYLEAYGADYNEIVEAYIIYYHTRAASDKWLYYITNTVKLLTIAAIPILQTVGIPDKYAWSITVASAITLFMESFMEMARFKEKWTMYRNTCNQLMRIQRQGPFSRESPIQVKKEQMEQYKERIESVVGDEARQWYIAHKEKENKT